MRVGLQSERLGFCLALGALFPAGLGAFVAAHMDVLAGEKLHYLAENSVDELVGGVIAGAQHIIAHAPYLPHVIRTAGAAEVGIGGKGSEHVTGKVYFGDNGYVTVGGVGYDVTSLVLGVETAIRYAVVHPGVVTYHSAFALWAYFGEFGKALDFNAPALVVGQVPVKGVDVVKREHVDEALHRVGGEEVARHIEVSAAVREAGFVSDRHSRKNDIVLACLGDSLAQGLHTVECACGGGAVNGYALGSDCKLIRLGVFALQSGGERNDTLCVGFGSQFRIQTGHLTDILRKELGVAHKRAVAFGVSDSGAGVKHKAFAFAGSNLLRKGHHTVVRGHFATGRATHSRDTQCCSCH